MSSDVRDDLMRHIASCPECRREFSAVDSWRQRQIHSRRMRRGLVAVLLVGLGAASTALFIDRSTSSLADVSTESVAPPPAPSADVPIADALVAASRDRIGSTEATSLLAQADGLLEVLGNRRPAVVGTNAEAFDALYGGLEAIRRADVGAAVAHLSFYADRDDRMGVHLWAIASYLGGAPEAAALARFERALQVAPSAGSLVGVSHWYAGKIALHLGRQELAAHHWQQVVDGGSGAFERSLAQGALTSIE